MSGATGRYRSGWCGHPLGHPLHRTCHGAYGLTVCTCACHEPDPLPEWLTTALGAAAGLTLDGGRPTVTAARAGILGAALLAGGHEPPADLVAAMSGWWDAADALLDERLAGAAEQTEHEAHVRST